MAEIKKFLKKNKGVKMNKKGIFFTLIIFLLATAIILAGAGMKSNTAAQEENITQQAAFESVNARFENIYNQVLAVKTGYPGRMQGRIIAPFEFDSGNIAWDTVLACPCTANPNGCGWMEIEQPLPLDTDSVEMTDVYDALNLYSIFISDQQINKDTTVSIIEVPKNSEWDPFSTESELSYLILPQCIRYYPTGLEISQNEIAYYTAGTAADNCTFNPSELKQIEFTVENEEEITVKSNWGGTGDLQDKEGSNATAYNPNDPKPYIKIEAKIPNCLPKGGTCLNHCCIDIYDSAWDNESIVSGHLYPLPFSNNGVT